jgi:hypothetical protein
MKASLIAVLAATAVIFGGCSDTTTNPETGLNATEETCAGNREWMETQKSCVDMAASEKALAERYAHAKQVEGEDKEAETVLKKREAERTADAIEGKG